MIHENTTVLVQTIKAFNQYLIPLLLDESIQKKVGKIGKLQIKITSPNLKAINDGLALPKAFLDVQEIPEVYEAHIGSEDGKDKHTIVDYDKGVELQKITTKNILKIGDLVAVRLVVSANENMEFVHLKDMRASCFEPVNVLSEYKYNQGLGFYMSTKDAATHFFFDQINKGTYVFEYDIRVNNSGDFSNGITTIQSMYSPEFANHTKGIRVTTK